MSHCDETLKLIGQIISEYLKINDDHYPPQLETLVEKGLITVWELICPVSPFAVGQCSYGYRGWDLYYGVPAEMVVAYDKLPNHKGRRNILFADGTVKRPPEKVFFSFIKIDNEYRQSLGLRTIEIRL